MTFRSKEDLPLLEAVAAFAGNPAPLLARRDALLLHGPASLPPEGAATHGVSNPCYTFGMFVFYTLLTTF